MAQGQGTNQPNSQHGNVTFSVLEGAHQHCLCFLPTACRERGSYLHLQVAGFMMDIVH